MCIKWNDYNNNEAYTQGVDIIIIVRATKQQL